MAFCPKSNQQITTHEGTLPVLFSWRTVLIPLNNSHLQFSKISRLLSEEPESFCFNPMRGQRSDLGTMAQELEESKLPSFGHLAKASPANNLRISAPLVVAICLSV